MKDFFNTTQNSEKKTVVDIKGEWKKQNLAKISNALESLFKKATPSSVVFVFDDEISFDSAGIILLIKYISKCTQAGATVTISNMQENHKRLLLFYRKNLVSKKISIKVKGGNILEATGKKSCEFYTNTIKFLKFIGETSYYFVLTLLNPSTIRFKAIINQIDLSGVKALPIIAVTSFLIGLVLAYQGAEQLSKFGANIFVVEMICISLFRELAPMITAIVIAGRSSSAYTAEIGTMKITEELDAMRSMGFEPSVFLVMPRIIALVISMPLLVFFANIIGIAGGAIIANYQLDISYIEFIHRMNNEVPMKHLVIGLIKAPIFGFIIAVIGCFRGFQVSGSTDSIGRFTTISVVNAIFWVIAFNALISVILTEMRI